MVIMVDIDETICHSVVGQYDTAEPIVENINRINKLYNDGNIIIYWTARGSITNKNWFEITHNQLLTWGAKFHELRMGKPYYDLLICDKTKRIEELL